MSRVVIVPGLHNSGPQHWQSLWQRRLPNSLRVEQQRWDVPDLKCWSDNVLDVLNALDASGEDCWIVAHSFGCLASVYALQQARSNVRGLFLAAPADPQKFAVADLLPAGSLSIPGRLIGSRSDPWLAWEHAEQWAQRWRLPIVCAGDAGHINVESGHGLWPEGWREFQKLQAAAQLPSHRYLALAI